MNESDARNRASLSHLPAETDGDRFRQVMEASNPLLEACRVLLRALADMKYMPVKSHQALNELREALMAEITALDQLCVRGSIRTDHAIAARYCLCTALDEMAMQSSWATENGNAAVWASRSLVNVFGMDGQGGDKIYLLVGRLMQDSDEHRDLLEVIYRVLSLGFEGRFRFVTDGPQKHHAVRTQIYNVISRDREAAPLALSPHARTDVEGGRISTWTLPVWVTAMIGVVAVFSVYGYEKYRLSMASDAVVSRLQSIAHLKPQALPPLQLKVLLQQEIMDGLVIVDESGRQSAVTFRGDTMFAPGAITLKTDVEPLMDKIAAELIKVPGKVTVTGYTDNIPMRGQRFSSNQALSEARAEQVLQMLRRFGVPDDRLTAVGMGEEDPVADNSTPQGRAQNRRVAISVSL